MKGLSGKQITSFIGKSDIEKLQSYITQIQEISNTGLFSFADNENQGLAILQAERYATALKDVDAAQTALLLSTQGLANAQIQQVLAAQNLTTAQQYEALSSAGLLKSKTALTNVEVQSTLQKAFSVEMSEADAAAKANETMASLGLSAAIQGENAQTTILTSKKLAELVESHKLTMAQAEEIAVRTGLTLSLKTQSSVMPRWIATLKAATLAVWDQIKATGVWLATTPAGWVTAAISAVALFAGSLSFLKKKHSETIEKIKESAETAQASIDSLNSTFQDTKAKAESALQAYNKLSDGIDLLSNKNLSLSDDDYQEFLNANNELASVFPQLVKYYDANGNAILNLGSNAEEAAEKINALVDAQKQQLASDIQEELPDVFAGLHQKAKEQNAENLFNISNSSFVGSIEQLQKIQSIIEKITGKKLDIQTSVEGNHFIDTYGALDLGEQLRVYQDVLSDKNYDALSDTTAQADKALSDIIRQYGSIQKAISALDTDSINREYQMQLQNIFTGLSSDDTYNTLDENTQHIVSSLISNLDYASVADEVAGSYNNDIIAYLQDNIIQPIADTLSDENTASTVQEAYKNLLSLNTDDALSSNIDKVRQYITTIAGALNRDFDEVAAGLGYDLDAKTAKVSNAQKKITGTDSVQANNQYDAKNAEMNQYIATLSEKEIDLLLNIPDDTKISTKEELENYLNSISDSSILSPITSSIEQISSLLEPQFTKLGEAYRNIFTEDGYTTENIDTSMLEGLRETFAQMESVTGTAFDTDELESFFAVLTSGTSDTEKMQKAFDDLASSSLDSTGILENLSEANANAVKTQLEALGVSNAQEIVNASLMQSENALANAQEEVTRL